MQRFWHVMKRTRTVSNPTNMLFFDTETLSEIEDGKPNVQIHKLWFGFAMAYRREGLEHTRYKEIYFKDTKTFWNFVLTRLDKKRPLWIFAHNMPFDLTIVDAWLSGDFYNIKVDLPVLDDPPIILLCSHSLGKLAFVDTFNYWKVGIADIGKNVGMDKLVMPDHHLYNEQWKQYCRRDVEIISAAIDNLIVWLESNDLGSMKYTTPSIAMSVYKHRFMPIDTILVHNDEKALELERGAYHGGLVMPYFIGEVNKTLYKFDVNSLYPAVMKKQYPVRLIQQFHKCNPDLLRKYLDGKGAVALVSIKTDDDPYPVVWGNKLIEAIGTFTVPLCGEELINALDKGHVTAVYRTQIYDMEDIFSSYVDYFWEMRKETLKLGDDMGNIFAKLMLNSLYGKFGQQSHVWVNLNPNSLEATYAVYGKEMPSIYKKMASFPIWDIGVHRWKPLGLPEELTIRALPDNVEFKVVRGEHHESSPIIAAYVTAYGRAFMRNLRSIAGKRHSFYTDTDSLITDSQGRQNLSSAGFINPVELGMLKLEGESGKTIIYGPKDYVFGENVVIKGVRKNATRKCLHCKTDNHVSLQTCVNCNRILSSNTFYQTQFEGLKSVLRRSPEPFIRISQVAKTLSRKFTKGTVRADGWVDFLRLNL